MKNLFIVLIALLSLTACRTQKEQAQRHLKKALQKDPSILSSYTKDTVLSGVAKGRDTIYIKGTSSEFDFDCDSIKKRLASVEAGKGVKIYSDSAKTFEVLKSSTGKLYGRLTTPADTIYKDVLVPYKVPVKVPGKAFIVYEDKQAYKYFWFWFLVALSAFLLYLLVRSHLKTKKDGNDNQI